MTENDRREREAIRYLERMLGPVVRRGGKEGVAGCARLPLWFRPRALSGGGSWVVGVEGEGEETVEGRRERAPRHRERQAETQ